MEIEVYIYNSPLTTHSGEQQRLELKLSIRIHTNSAFIPREKPQIFL